jgi:hypothetical protein
MNHNSIEQTFKKTNLSRDLKKTLDSSKLDNVQRIVFVVIVIVASPMHLQSWLQHATCCNL